MGHDLSGALEARADSTEAGAIHEASAADDEAPETKSLIVEGRLSLLAGMQLKFSMSMVNDRLAIPARGQGGLWIVKLPGSEFAELPYVEQATMTWAKLAGFGVPTHFALPIERLDGIPLGWTEGATHAFAVKRFDRRDDGSKIHQEDLCQALDLLPGNKYGDISPKVTFDGALRLVTDVCGEAEGREMAQRMGFVIASGNGDAHLKNWSLLWGDATRPTLTPCYDLVVTIAWERLGWQRRGGPKLALRMGGEDRFAHIDTLALATLAKKSGQSWAEEETMAGIQRARDAWSHVRDDVPAVMREAIVTHWDSVPILSKVGLPP
ncbi:HipA domain-containing protein [Pendulispora albinea]|uniref:HipA domain-containing protein n=2 Tax=Pendulispora albinea TaxID=2741071 RepID=A0ABZ2M9D1_9BACT